MRMPSHSALCSFVFSLILTCSLVPSSGDVSLAAVGAPGAQLAVESVLNGLRAQGLAGSNFVLPPSPAAPSAALAPTAFVPPTQLTPELLSKILQLIGLRGIDQVIPARIVNALGLTATGEDWPDHKIGAQDNPKDPNTLMHSFAVSRASDQDVVLTQSNKVSIHSYRAHRDGTLVAALTFNKTTGELSMRSPVEAQADLAAEFKFWADNVDFLLRGK